MSKFKVWEGAAVIGAVKAANAEDALNKAKAGDFFARQGITTWNSEHLTVTKY